MFGLVCPSCAMRLRYQAAVEPVCVRDLLTEENDRNRERVQMTEEKIGEGEISTNSATNMISKGKLVTCSRAPFSVGVAGPSCNGE